jgi:hypothetical protein
LPRHLSKAPALARDGDEMRAAFAAGSFDVVIIDVRLPGSENGMALARQGSRARMWDRYDHWRSQPFGRSGENRPSLSAKAIPRRGNAGSDAGRH